MNNVCEKCNDRGFYVDEKGKAVICFCRTKQEKLEFLQPLKTFLSSNATTAKPIRIQNISQVIIWNEQNIVGLVQLALNSWFPHSYSISTFERINQIGFERNSEFNSIREYAQLSLYHIIDCRFMNKFRSRNQGFKDCDSQYVVELIKEVMSNDGIVVIIVGKNSNIFFKDYQELCDMFPDFGIQYLQNGKYCPLPKSKDKNDDQ